MPRPRALASSAAMAGIGEALPTAMWRTSPIRRVMTSASNSSSRQAVEGGAFTRPSSRGAAGMDVLLEITGEPLGGGGEAGIFAHMGEVGGIMVGQAERPAAVLGDRDRIHIETRQGARREHGIVEQIAVDELLHGDHGLLARMGHGGKLALA